MLHPDFLAGGFTTSFLDQTPELFLLPMRQDRATKVLTYIADVIVNGDRQKSRMRKKAVFREPVPVPPLWLRRRRFRLPPETGR